MLVSPVICPHTNCTLIPEENLIENGSTEELKDDSCSPIQKNSQFDRKNSNGINKKHVQFPDEIKVCTETAVTLDFLHHEKYNNNENVK